jgi:hypothetical protein
MGGAAAAATKWHLTLSRSGPPIDVPVSIITRNPAADLLQVLRPLTIDTN